MEANTMGRVTVAASIENLEDLLSVEKGQLPAANARRLEISNALVDTGATALSLPVKMVDELGLRRRRTRKSMTATGPQETSICDAVRLTVQDRFCTIDVVELPDDCPVLIGQVPLELMDFVVDPKRQRLIANPDHGGEWTWELY